MMIMRFSIYRMNRSLVTVTSQSNKKKRTTEEIVMFLIQRSTNLLHLTQLHTFIIKTSLHHNNFILAKLLRRIISSSSSSAIVVLPYARSLFDSIPSPDTFIWNTMIRAYLISQLPFKLFSLFLQFQRQHDVFPDSFSLSLVLQACQLSTKHINGPMLHSQVVKLGFDCDLFVQTDLLKMYAKFGFIDTARKVFDEMTEPDLVSYNVLLAEYVRVSQMNLAQNLFDRMPERDLVSWNTMIHGYATQGNVTIARMLFDTSSERDVVSWSSIIAAYAKSGQSAEALRLFHEMQLANVVPDKVIMVSVLCACGDLGALGMGKMVHEYIERKGIEIDLKLGTSLVDMYAKGGDIDNAIRTFSQMSRRDVYAWNAIITGLANHGFGEVALELFDRMISEGTKPNDITFVGVLSACNHIGLVDKGWTYFNSMSIVHQITPKMEHYGSMVDILSRAGRVEEARELISSMPFEPDAVVWRTLLGACKVYKKNVKLAEEATMNLQSLEPYTDGNYVLLSNIYSQEKKWDEVSNVRRMMKNRNIKKVPGSSSIEVDNTVHEFVAGDKSHPQFDEIYQLLAEIALRLKHVEY